MASPATRRPTIRDVARLAGVSIKTVSRVINESPEVARKSRERVEWAIHELDFTPNVAAAGLRRNDRSTRSIAVVTQDLGNNFSSQLLRSLERSEFLKDVALLAASLDEEPERERRVVKDLVAHQVDGLVLVPTLSDQSYLRTVVNSGLAVVCVDRRPRGLPVDSVTTDNWLGAQMGTAHLIAAGHRQIACLGDRTTIEPAQDRLTGYLDAMRDAGVPVDSRLVLSGERSAEDGRRAVQSLIDEGVDFTAILVCRNDLSIGALEALQHNGLQHTVAIVGFDDMPMASLVDPPLTVVRQDIDQLARATVDCLAERIRGSSAAPRDIVIRPTLVERGSGEIPAPR
ncbi:LacI family DNA-binding transcriptional regulator [Acidipropionibacterium jensenii]|uniref:LacI family transcriptional regulator n=1 Tax=Acidipropionibacterium jensenii TaxID=1749 RepID=A0A3Q9UC87_9ACTN|nr:LacI family DNA-binding transcriptional regulator [Acidipropionibacterium jensenii]AZZ38451.1 LacI family transcriptional regulator [Acidipropionibacterium jensenii]AZZ40981.1 LacI family transcriptional regulator [Acidipropionibacterium jensenii]